MHVLGRIRVVCPKVVRSRSPFVGMEASLHLSSQVGILRNLGALRHELVIASEKPTEVLERDAAIRPYETVVSPGLHVDSSRAVRITVCMMRVDAVDDAGMGELLKPVAHLANLRFRAIPPHQLQCRRGCHWPNNLLP